MAQAIKFTEKTIPLVRLYTEETTADLQARFEDYNALNETFWFVIDYTNINGYYFPWSFMRDDYFYENHVWTEQPKTGFRYFRLK